MLSVTAARVPRCHLPDRTLTRHAARDSVRADHPRAGGRAMIPAPSVPVDAAAPRTAAEHIALGLAL